MSGYIHHISPARGRWLRWLVNLALRISVKWRLGLHIDIPRLRGLLAMANHQAGKQPLGVLREPVVCNGVSAEWLIPRDVLAGRVLLYIHGGAFVARSPEVHAGMVAAWCRSLNARALMVDYRLAPEQPWPAAAEDCHATYRWLLDQGVDAGDIVMAGDSAGGNLALATLHRIKQAGEALPACAVLLSPFTDFTLSGDSMVGNSRQDPIFTLAFANAIRGLYAAPGEFLEPDVSPLFGDFAGLPPMLFQVGSTEMLLDDSVRTARRAHAAGVEVQLEIWDRLPHVFQALPLLPQARQARCHILDFICLHSNWDTAETACPAAINLNQPEGENA